MLALYLGIVTLRCHLRQDCWCSKRQPPNPAFTLIELLAVLGVLGILSAILLTALAAAKSKARQAGCAHNVGQLGLALQGFVTDYHAYPKFIWKNEEDKGTEHSSSWRAALEREMVPSFDPFKDDTVLLRSGVWLCPCAQRPDNWAAHFGYNSYNYNGRGLGDLDQMLGLANAFQSDEAVKDSAVASPSDMLAIGDAFQGAFGRGIILDGNGFNRIDRPLPATGMGPYVDLAEMNACTRRAYARHFGRANVAFCDGHVSAPKIDFLFKDTSDAALERWNRDHQPHRELLQR